MSRNDATIGGGERRGRNLRLHENKSQTIEETSQSLICQLTNSDQGKPMSGKIKILEKNPYLIVRYIFFYSLITVIKLMKLCYKLFTLALRSR